MNKWRKRILITFIVAVFISLFTMVSSAANGLEGYAIHRDGAFGGITWHAGLMYGTKPEEEPSVIHAGQLSNSGTVIYGIWSDFLNGNNFKGFYAPKEGIDSTSRDLVKSMAQSLITENILYTPLQQLKTASNPSNYIQPSEITSIRCDGVVEYCYEYYNYRIYGSDSKWDISKNGNQAHHALTNITPKSQAQSYMTPWFNIINVNSNKGLQVPNGITTNGTDLTQFTVTNGGGDNKKWKLDYSASGHYFTLIPKCGVSKAVEITNTSPYNDAVFQIWDIPSTGYMNSQKFKLYIYSDGSLAFRTYSSNYNKIMAVDGASTANGAAIVQLGTPGAASKRWKLVAVSP